MAITAHDIVSDSPTNNFATLSPLWNGYNSSYPQSDGNLKAVTPTSGSFKHSSTMSIPKTGKWYFELHCTSGSQTDGNNVTFCPIWTGIKADTSANYSIIFYGYGYIVIYVNGSSSNVGSALDHKVVVGDIVGYYFDLENNEYKAYVNGTLVKTVDLSSYSLNLDSLDYFINIDDGTGTVGTTQTLNFGQDPTFGGAESPTTTYTDANGIGAFYYQPPTGALALCTANLTDFTPDVDNDTPQDYFKAVTYPGNETVGVSEDLGFRPDMIWAKARNVAYNHILIDSLRPHSDANSYYRLHPDTTNNQADYNDNIYITNNGFNCYPRQSGVNENNKTFVAWCWKAGGAPTADNTATSGAMDANSVSLNGTLQSNYTPAGSPTIYPKRMSINTDAGFSIVKYQGASASNSKLPHGLTQAPEMVIIKNLDNANGWVIGNDYLTNWGYSLGLDLPNAEYTSAASFDSTAPTNSVITLGNSSGANNSSYNYIAYCFHSVEGYSKFGSYTGNGSADGPFVYCGFRPAFVICKGGNVSSYWVIHDSARNGYNGNNKDLYASLSQTEASSNMIDILSGGFKIRVTTGEINGNGSYIFMAFSEQPFKFSNAR
jgi:hypothetical protein